MEDKLRRYVDGLFMDTVPTKKAVELKEEMIQNLEDKYKDLMSDGKTPEAAYNIAVAGIGDVSALLAELATDADSSPWLVVEYEEARRKSAMLTAVAVMLYILSVLPLILFASLAGRFVPSIGIPLMFVLIAAATGLLIYNNMTKPRYQKSSDTMVDEFREWQSDTLGRRQLRKAISSALWTIIVAVYFLISFYTGAWHLTWIIFLLGAAVESFINIFLSLRK